MICSTVGFVSCFCVPIACLCTMAQGSRAGKLKYLWEYSFQTSLYSSFCLLVPVPVRTYRIWLSWHSPKGDLATSSRRCWRTPPSPLPLPLPSPDLIHGLDLADAEGGGGSNEIWRTFPIRGCGGFKISLQSLWRIFSPHKECGHSPCSMFVEETYLLIITKLLSLSVLPHSGDSAQVPQECTTLPIKETSCRMYIMIVLFRRNSYFWILTGVKKLY